MGNRQGRDHNGRFLKNGKNNPGRHYKPGESGNPRGRPAHKTMTEGLKAELARGNHSQEIIEKVGGLAIKGERWATELIWDRVDGRPVTRVDIRARLVARATAAGIDPDEAIAAADAIIKERDW